MRKQIFALVLSICLLCSAVPMSASAASVSGGTGSTSLSYTVDNYYSIVIPSTIDLNNQTSFQITATGCEIGEGKQLIVEVDPASTYEDDGMMYLYKDKGSQTEQKMLCRLAVAPTADGTGGSYIDSSFGTGTTVATFHNGITTPVTDGYLKLIPFPTGKPSGTYTGAVFFTIRIEDIV